MLSFNYEQPQVVVVVGLGSEQFVEAADEDSEEGKRCFKMCHQLNIN